MIGGGIARELAAAGSDVVLQVERAADRPARVEDTTEARELIEEIEGMGRLTDGGITSSV